MTTLQILPGSANLFGGRSAILRNVPGRTVQDMKFPGAPYGLKMACGENPKRVYGSRDRAPSTRMGNVAGYRAAWIKAADYERKWDEYHKKIARGDHADPPTRDLQLDTLVGVLKGKILVQNHCYRADEMAQMIDISKEFGFHVTMFHHAVEAYKIADLLKANDVCVTVWANWGGFKLEAYDAIEENAALVHAAGACVTIHSDDSEPDPAPQPGSGRSAVGRAARRARHSRARSDHVDHAQFGQGARHSRPDGHARTRQARRRRDLEQGSVLDLCADAESLHRRRPCLRPPRSGLPTQIRLHGRPGRRST